MEKVKKIGENDINKENENENKEYNDNIEENHALVVVKEENIIIKILNKIKSIFKRK